MSKDSWYTIRAAGKKRASIDIDGEIGMFGVSSKQFKQDIADLGDVSNIKLTLNSIGGSVGDGVSIKNTLKDHPAKVNVHIDGYALSIASVIATAGDKVTAADDALMMIHDPWSFAIGSADDMRKEANTLDKHKDAIVQSYLSRDLDMSEDELREAMADETWYTAAEAREAGFVDKVAKSDNAKNSANIDFTSADLFKYKNAPKHFTERFARAESSQPKDGAAVETTEGTKMTKEVEVSEADIEARIKAAVDANDEKWTALMSHENAGNTEAVLKIAAMDMDAEKSASMMDLVEKPKAEVVAEAAEEVKDDKQDEAAASAAQVQAVFAKLMENSDVNAANKNASTDDDKPKSKPSVVELYQEYK